MKARGFTLIEVLAAITIIVIGIGGLFALVRQTIVFSSRASFVIRGSYLAQEGVEIVRNIRDSNLLEIHNDNTGNWDDGLTSCSSGCEADYNDTSLGTNLDRFLKEGASFYNYDSGTDSAFKRKITVSASSATQLDVIVEVTWSERGLPGSIIVETRLYNWINP